MSYASRLSRPNSRHITTALRGYVTLDEYHRNHNALIDYLVGRWAVTTDRTDTHRILCFYPDWRSIPPQPLVGAPALVNDERAIYIQGLAIHLSPGTAMAICYVMICQEDRGLGAISVKFRLDRIEVLQGHPAVVYQHPPEFWLTMSTLLDFLCKTM